MIVQTKYRIYFISTGQPDLEETYYFYEKKWKAIYSHRFFKKRRFGFYLMILKKFYDNNIEQT